ncbi:MAG: hypothetical protein Q7J54_06125 [Candidatus Woesearchaeota archaeon]|nr:hypothetical protein [Candidatus Woesearchaeota archaeon]
MPLFHRNINARLLQHIEELKKLGILPNKWKWHKDQIEKLELVDEKLIQDLIDMHAKIQEKKIKTGYYEDFEFLITPLYTLRRDLQIMLKQENLTDSMRASEAEAVNRLIAEIEKHFEGENEWYGKKAAARINRIKNIIAEIRKILEENYPARAGMFDIVYEQDPTIKPSDHRAFPAFFVFLENRKDWRKRYIIAHLLREDLDAKVKLSDLRSKYQLDYSLKEEMKKSLADEQQPEETLSIVRKIFHEIILFAANNRIADLYLKKTFEAAYNILLKQSGYMQYDNSIPLQIIREMIKRGMLPEYDALKQEWLISQVRHEYSINQKDAENIYFEICELIVGDLKARKNQGEEVHWKAEVKKAAGSDKIMIEAVMLHEQNQGRAARADEKKIKWIVFLFRDWSKVYMRDGKYSEYAFSKLEKELERQWHRKGFEP